MKSMKSNSYHTKFRMALFAGVLFTSSLLFGADDRPYTGIQEETERQLEAISRETGFQGPLIDRLHERIGINLGLFLKNYGLEKRASTDLLDIDNTGRMVHGVDKSGRPYLRVMVDQKNDTGGFTFQYPVIRKTHVYLFPGQDGKTLDRIIIQLYQVSIFEQSNYARELRRVIHPEPRPEDAAEGVAFKSNAGITVEYYSRDPGKPDFPQDPAGIPLPDLDTEPETSVKLVDEDSPLQFENQVRMIDLYKKVLFIVNGRLHFWNEMVRLEKARQIEQALDF